MVIVMKRSRNFLYFSQNEQEMSAVFTVVCFSMSHLLLQRCGTIKFPRKCSGGRHKGWYEDAHFKQWDVTEFLVTEKEEVMNL